MCLCGMQYLGPLTASLRDFHFFFNYKMGDAIFLLRFLISWFDLFLLFPQNGQYMINVKCGFQFQPALVKKTLVLRANFLSPLCSEESSLCLKTKEWHLCHDATSLTLKPRF